MENVAVNHESSGKDTNSTSNYSECAGPSTYLVTKLETGTIEAAWHEPVSKSGSSKCRDIVLNSDNPVASCTLTDHCISSELKERLSLNTSTENLNGLINGSLEVSNHQQPNVSEEPPKSTNNSSVVELSTINYVQYESELQMPLIMKIIQKDLSEPYSIYTYRYFIHNWPKLCFLAMCEDKCVGAIVCKLDIHRKVTIRGYIAMLAVDQNYRKRSIGSTLVKRAIREMIKGGADEVVLETEVTNKPALRLYEALGFVRDKRLFRYYLNGVDALRLKLWLR